MLAALPRSPRVCPPPGRRRARRRSPGSADALALAQLAAACAAREAAARRRRRRRARRAAARRRDAVVRAGPCASRCCPTGKRCPTITSRRTRTWSRSGSPRSTTSRAANATCSSSPRRPRSTASRRRTYLAAFTFFLKQGTRLDVDALRAQLALAGYQHVTQVVSPGEFSVRGGLIDLFPMGSALPYRLDLFDDDIESIRTFDVDTQRTLYPVPDVRLLPAREFPLDEAGRTRFRSALPRGVRGRSVALAAVQGREQRRRARRHRVLPAAVLRGDRDARRLPAAGRRRRAASATSRAPIERFWQDTDSRYKLLRGDKSRPLLPPTEVFLPPDAFNGALKAFARVEIPAAASRTGGRADAPAPSRCRRVAGRPPRGRSARRAEALPRRRRRARADLRRERRPARDDAAVLRRVRARACRSPTTGAAFVAGDATRARWSSRRCTRASRGREAKLAFVTEAELYAGVVRRGKRDAARRTNVDAMLRDLSEVRIGDPVVHEQHGIGRYLGLVTMDLGDGAAEFLQLVYANDAKLYVPVANLHLIGRYSGASPEAAPLHELGSGQWDKAKKRAARQAHDTAAELLNLYAQRAARKGHAFKFKPHDYEAFAEGFGFEETPDQQAAIEAVIEDLTDGQADGPAGLRRRRLRQDRSRAARGVRRGRRRQAGRGARADDAARRAALPGVLRPLRRLAGEARRAVALPLRQGGEGGARRPRGRHDRPRHRHAQADPARRQVQEPRPRHHRRGAPLRRAPEGAAEEAARRGRRADADRDADPAHARDVARGHPRLLGDRHRAAAAARDQDLRRRRTRAASSARRCCAS